MVLTPCLQYATAGRRNGGCSSTNEDNKNHDGCKNRIRLLCRDGTSGDLELVLHLHLHLKEPIIVRRTLAVAPAGRLSLLSRMTAGTLPASLGIAGTTTYGTIHKIIESANFRRRRGCRFTQGVLLAGHDDQ